MDAIIIKRKSKDNLRLLAELAKKLGEEVSTLYNDQMEDMVLCKLMKQVKTGKSVSRKTVIRHLRS